MHSRPTTASTRMRRATAALAAATLGLALSACASEDDKTGTGSDAVETTTFKADNGDVEIPVKPTRVVATGYAVPVLLEADAPLVGISEWGRGTAMMTKDDLADYESTTKIMGETADSINYDAVAKADPDVIILGVPLPVLGDVNMERLEQVAPVVVLGPSVPDSWKELSARQAEAAGVRSNVEEQEKTYTTKAAELAAKWADSLEGAKFGHVGAYGDISAGSFHREFAGSWGTTATGDVGAEYYGEVKDPSEGGSATVSEYPSIEELPQSLGDATHITYTVDVDGKPSKAVQYVLDSPLWKNLPAVKAGHAIPVRYTEAATWPSALLTLDAIDESFTEVLGARGADQQ